MSFGGSGGGGGSIATSGDVSLNNPANNQVLTYDGTSAKWKNAATSGSTTPGLIYFDTYFAGADDNAKMTAMNNWAMNHGGQPQPGVVFDTRVYNFTVPIKLFSGLKLVGGSMSPAREYSRSTVFNWQGASGTSLFIFPTEGQTYQSYPSDGSPRDISVSFIQMQGGGSTHCIQNFDPTGGAYSGHTLWSSDFHDCGFKNFQTVWWGWGDGTSISGQTHFEALTSTALYIGGSENRIFGNDAYSFAGYPNDPGVPFMRSIMAKSYIGNCMITTRKGSTALTIEGGHNLVVDGMAFDAQSSDPTYGAGVVITGGDGISIINCSFKGMATQPASGWGGAANNRAWIQVNGGDQIVLQSNSFHREGNNMPATSYPLLFVASSVANGAVKWGYNSYSSFGTDSAVIQQAATGKITAISDARLTVTTAA